jgi:hypothetical protein
MGSMDGHKFESWEIIVDNELCLIFERTSVSGAETVPRRRV